MSQGVISWFRHPVGWFADIDRMVQRKRRAVEHHLVADGGPHTEVVPRGNDPDAWAIGGDEEVTHPRLRFICFRPHGTPGEPGRTGRINLGSREGPPVGAPPRHRLGQSAAYGCSQFGFHPQTADQAPARHDLPHQSLIKAGANDAVSVPYENRILSGIATHPRSS